MMMDHKQQCSNQDYPASLLSNNNTAAAAGAAASPSPRKPPVSGGGNGGGGDRSKRDEWSEGAVSTLIDAYESKWVLRNRAKLKGQDWEDVARYVSCRANSSKSPKTQTQCKNKIESMKKRYRSESATSDGSSWPLFQRLDLLLRGSGPPPPHPPPSIVPQLPPPAPAPVPPTILAKAPAMVTDHPVVTQVVEPPQPQEESRPPTSVAAGQNSHGSGGGLDRGLNKVDEVAVTKVSDPCANDDDNNGSSSSSSSSSSDKNLAMETDSSTPAARYSDNKEKKLKQGGGKRGRMRSSGGLPEKSSRRKKKKRRRKGREDVEIAESIRWLGEVVVRTEQARMDTMKDLEKMRAEAEAKRGEIDLKRTEIMANTQLEIARIFAAAAGGGGGKKEGGGGGNIDSSLRIGRS